MSNEKPCIAFFTRYLPSMGGVEVFTDNLATALTKKGIKCLIITTDNGESEKAQRFPVIRIPSNNLLDGRYPVFNTVKAAQAIKRTLKDYGVTSIVINGRFYQLSRFGAKTAKELGITPIVIDHSSSYVADTSNIIGKCLAIADHVSTKLLNRYGPKYFCVSKLSSEWIQTFGLTSSGEIHNAINANEFRNNASALPLVKVNDDSISVIYAGRLIPEKGVMKLAEAVRDLDDVELFIAGSGPLENDVKALCEIVQNAHFLGRLSHPDLASVLKQSDIFCFPTEYGEGLPTCLLEAGSCGCALITTNTGGTEEIIPNSNFGIVLGEVNPTTIRNAINSLCHDKERMNSMKSAIREHVEKTFSWDNTIRELLEAIFIADED